MEVAELARDVHRRSYAAFSALQHGVAEAVREGPVGPVAAFSFRVTSHARPLERGLATLRLHGVCTQASLTRSRSLEILTRLEACSPRSRDPIGETRSKLVAQSATRLLLGGLDLAAQGGVLLDILVGLGLHAVVVALEVLDLVHQVSLLLTPLGAFTLVSQEQLGLLGFCPLNLQIEFSLLLTEGLPFLLQLQLILPDLLLALLLDQVQFLGQSGVQLAVFVVLLAQIDELCALVSCLQLQPLGQVLLLALELLHLGHGIVILQLRLLLQFLQSLCISGLDGHDLGGMGRIGLIFAVVLRPLQLLNSLLEVTLGVFQVTLGLFLLLLEEFELSVPESLVLVVVVVEVLELAVEFRVLPTQTVSLNLLLCGRALPTVLKLVVLFTEPLDLHLVVLGALLLLVLQVLSLHHKLCGVLLFLGHIFLEPLFKVLEGFPLGLILCI